MKILSPGTDVVPAHRPGHGVALLFAAQKPRADHPPELNFRILTDVLEQV